MAMGRGSDTRMYAPRSESSHMYSSANEDEDKYSPTSPEDNDKRAEEKKLKEEASKKKKLNILRLNHLKELAKDRDWKQNPVLMMVTSVMMSVR